MGFFKRKTDEIQKCDDPSGPRVDNSQSNSEIRPTKSLRVEVNDGFDMKSFERDLGKRPQVWDIPPEKRDEVRRAYIKFGPFHPVLSKYPKCGEKHSRSFQPSWFKLFPSWLEYSPHADAAYCLPCFLFHKKDGPTKLEVFTVTGFRSWKKVRDGKNCAFLTHIGKDLTSPHRNSERACAYLMNQPSHIARSFERFKSQEVEENQLRLKASIEAIRWLAFQGCAYRGRNESSASTNRGNFLELLSFIASYNDKVLVVLDKAPRNASYTSPTTQKQILHVIAKKVKNYIREEISDARYCILVDKARDESKREQMSLVLRFVDKDSYVQERFFGLVHVQDTATSTLKEAICSILSNNNVDVKFSRGQGYDGASNTRGEWNGLRALIASECPYAYYVHCFVHRLQFALVAASKEVIVTHQFFVKLNSIINIVGASCKLNDQLKVAHAANIAHLLENDGLDSGKGHNQIGSLQRAGDTRWSSHLKSISSLMTMFSATCEVLLNIIEDGTTTTQ